MSDAPRWEDSEEIKPTPVAPSWDDSEPLGAAENPHDLIPAAKAAGKGLWEGIKGAAGVVAEAVTHPVDTATNIGDWMLMSGGPAGNQDDTLINSRTVRSTPIIGKTIDNLGLLAQGLAGNDIDEAKRAQEEDDAQHAARSPKIAGLQKILGQALVGPMAANPLVQGADAGIRSISEDNSAGDVLKDSRNAALFTSIMNNAAKGTGVVANKASGALKEAAENRAASAMGWSKAMRRKYGADAAKEAGRVGLDEGVVTPLASTADKLERMEGVRAAAGQTIGDTMSKLDDAGVAEFNPMSAAAKVHNEIGAPYANEPLFSSQAGQYDKLLETILKRGGQNTSYAEAQALKELIGRYGYKEGVAVPGREQAQQAYGIINRELDGAVDRGAQQLGNPDLLKTLQGARKQYGAAKTTLDALDDKHAGELGNQQFGLGSKVLAAGEIAAGRPGKAAQLVGIDKAVKAVGNNFAAVGADKAAKLLANNPKALGKYAAILANATQRGPEAMAVTHALLMRDPEYAALVGEPEATK